MSDFAQIHDCFDIAEPKERLFRIGSRYRSAREVLHDADESLRRGQAALEVKGPASFSGQLINARVYPGPKVKAAAHTFTKDYEKPLLLHHQSGAGLFSSPSDPIGRVKKARFIPYVDAQALRQDFLNPTPRGSGELFVVSHVTDPDAIQKVLDGRYKTVSVGFQTSSLTCSICQTDWILDGRCEHDPMQVYDVGEGKRTKRQLAYLITGDKAYNELSFVNIPAAKGAVVSSHEFVDSLEDALQNPHDDAAALLERRPLALVFDHLTIGDETYDIVDAADREVVHVRDQSSVEPQVINRLVHSVERLVSLHLDTSQPSDTSRVLHPSSVPQHNDQPRGDASMADADNKTDATPDKTCECVDQTARVQELEADIAKAAADREALEQKIKGLTDENAELAAANQRYLADRLLDIRVRMGHPSVAAIKTDEEREEQLKKLTERTKASLEDAIADELPLLEQREAKQDSFVPERGSVTPEDAAVGVDRKQDTPSPARPVGPPPAYREQIAKAFAAD